MNPPLFPKEILAAMPIDPATSAPAYHTVDELDSEPTQSPHHAQHGKATSVAKKGKSKGVGSSKKVKKKVHAIVEPWLILMLKLLLHILLPRRRRQWLL